MDIDLTTMKAIMESDKFALYIIKELGKKDKFEGVRLDKRTNKQVGVYIEKTNQPYPPYRVIGFVQENNLQR